MEVVINRSVRRRRCGLPLLTIIQQLVDILTAVHYECVGEKLMLRVV